MTESQPAGPHRYPPTPRQTELDIRIKGSTMPNRHARSAPACSAILKAAELRDRLLHARRYLPACAIAATVAALPGCVAVGGTSRQESPTLGRQLMDLKSAYDTGAISEDEYKAAKQGILNPTK